MDGKIPRICNEPSCGTLSDQIEIINDKGTLKNQLSKKCKKNILTNLICTHKLDYRIRKVIYQKFKDKHIDDVYLFANLIYDELQTYGYVISYDYIIKTIYEYYDPLLDLT